MMKSSAQPVNWVGKRLPWVLGQEKTRLYRGFHYNREISSIISLPSSVVFYSPTNRLSRKIHSSSSTFHNFWSIAVIMLDFGACVFYIKDGKRKLPGTALGKCSPREPRWPLFPVAYPERCPSGRRCSTGNAVCITSAPRVQIPPSPPSP